MFAGYGTNDSPIGVDKMKIRKLVAKDRSQYQDLCRFAFGFNEERSRRYVTHKKEYDNAFGAFDGKKLAAGMWYYPFDMRVGDKYIPMAGVSSVATWPEYRHRGLVRKLMAEGQKYMKKNGFATSVLLPFKFSFYERMGYATAFDILACEFNPNQIKDFPTGQYRIEEIDGPQHWRELEEVHRRFGEQRNGTVKRDLAYWKRRYFRHGKYIMRLYLVYRAKSPCGFVLTGVEEPREFERARMLITQLAWTEPGAARAIFTFFKSHSDQFEKIKIFVPTDIDILQYFEDPRILAKLIPKMMFKLVDVASALEMRSYPDVTGGEVGVKVQGDPTAPWNTGHYRLSFDSEKVYVKKSKSGSGVKGDVSISIQALSQLYLGYYTVEELSHMKAIAGSKPALAVLDRAFPKSPVYIEDWF